MTTSRPSLRVRKVWPAVKPEHFARSSWGSWPFVRPRQWSLTHTLKATGIEVYEILWNHERQAHLIEVFRVADGGLNLISFAWIGWKGQFNFKQSCFQTPKLAGGVSAYVFQYSCPSTAIKEDGSKIRDDGTKNDHQHFWVLWVIHQIGESRREQPEGFSADPLKKSLNEPAWMRFRARVVFFTWHFPGIGSSDLFGEPSASSLACVSNALFVWLPNKAPTILTHPKRKPTIIQYNIQLNNIAYSRIHTFTYSHVTRTCAKYFRTSTILFYKGLCNMLLLFCIYVYIHV